MTYPPMSLPLAESAVSISAAVSDYMARQDYLVDLFAAGPNLYHLTAGGECSWYEFASSVFEAAGLHPEVCPVTSAEFPVKAKRPNYSVLYNARFRATGATDMRHWREALGEYIHGRVVARHA